MEVLVLKPNYYSYDTKTYLGFKKAALLAVIKIPLEKNNLKKYCSAALLSALFLV